MVIVYGVEPGFTMTYITCVCARVCVIREMASLDR
jgi:hypothetical protein